MEGAALSAALGEAPGEAERARFEQGVALRAERRPLSHVTGAREFWGRSFRVTPDVLDPRPESETLVAWALERRFDSVLDLGVGSGCLLLTLLAERPEAAGEGVDASPAALAVAAENARALGLAERARLRLGDWTEGAAPADLVVANPPYLRTEELAALSPETAREPRAALDGGPDGLAPYRRIAAGLGRVLRPGGAALFEVGPDQAARVAEMLAAAGLSGAETRRDLDGRERVVKVWAPTS